MYLLFTIVTLYDTEESISMGERRKRDRKETWAEEKRNGKIKERRKESESKFSTWGI